MAINLAATQIRKTVHESLDRYTPAPPQAQGVAGSTGTLEAGKSCDLAIWNIERPAELVYRMGFNPLHARVWRGT
jgi:imidazolonepropionase